MDDRRANTHGFILASVALVLGVAACPGKQTPPRSRSCQGLAEAPQDLGRAAHVLIVSIDGLHPDLIDARETPTLHRLVHEGAYSLSSRTVSPSLTLPAHASMVTGVAPELHGVLWNEYEPGRGPPRVPTIFSIARAAGFKTALVAGKEKLLQLGGPGSLDHASASARADGAVMAEALDYLASDRPNLMLIHLADVDGFGHYYGWLSPRQRRAAGRADAALGELVAALERLGLRDDALVIVTTDHGGEGRDHDGGRPADLVIPWIAWGDGVTPRELRPVCVSATATAALRALGLDLPRP
jgi:hypothetical protein